MSLSNTIVLVTGGSGFIGSHVVNRLLLKGYTVRTTVRSLSKVEQVKKQVLPPSGPSTNDRLSFFEVDLLSDKGWAEATTGIDYLLHVASPFPSAAPKHEDDLIKPAVQGTLRALRFAKEKGIKRVVVTSSVAAIGYGHTNYDNITLDETYWTNVDRIPGQAYIKSKTLAEKAAWDYAKANNVDLSVINPVLVLGPLLPGTKDIGTSIDIVRRIANGTLPAAPKLSLGAVDVRDVADMHILAMTKPEAVGKRFLATTGDGTFTNLQEIGDILGKRVYVVPDFIIRLGSYVSASLASLAGDLGIVKKMSNKQAREVLGVNFISLEEATKATVESLKTEGLL